MAQITPCPPEVSYAELGQLLNAELEVRDNNYFCSIRGASRLLNMHHSSLIDGRKQANGLAKGLLRRLPDWRPEDLPDSLKPIAGFDYKNQPQLTTAATTRTHQNYMLPEVVVSSLVKYYAYDARETSERAKRLDALFSSIGVRSVFSKIKQAPECLAVSEVRSVPIPSVDNLLYAETEVDKALRLFQRLDSARLSTQQINNFIRTNLLSVDDEPVNTTYRGVVKHKSGWRAQISVNGVSRPIGTYPTPEEAARVYDSYAIIVYGDKAKLNF
jgi:hypothetical protein